MKINKKKIILVLSILFTLAGLRYLLIPNQLHAEYLPKKKVYEYDQISKDDFVVYTTCRLGFRKEILEYHINSDTVSQTGLVAITSFEPRLGVLVDLKSIEVASSSILYDTVVYEDRAKEYKPNVSEVITYIDGKKEIIPESQLKVTMTTEEKEAEVKINVDGKHDEYAMEIPMIRVTSITTEDKKSTAKKLTSDQLDLTIHYSDGTTVKAEKGDITCDSIDHPVEGINKLTCYYDKKPYTVEVECYRPKNIVSFPGYGNVELQYKKAYHIEGANRLNSYNGVVYFNNHRETFYTIYEAGGVTTALPVPGRHVAEDGTIRDQEGYICLASDYKFCHKHQVVLTSLGPGKVYDTGCRYGTVDLYVNWR